MFPPDPFIFFNFFQWVFGFNHNETLCQAGTRKRRVSGKAAGKAGKSRRER